MTFSCNCPAEEAKVIKIQSGNQEAAPRLTDSGMTGLTLPGMMELPGCICGRSNSLRPQRGPEGEHADVVADLGQLAGSPFDDAGEQDVVAGVGGGGDQVICQNELRCVSSLR